MATTVRDILEGSRAAHLAASLDIGAGGTVAIWENRNDRLSYHVPSGHVFSLYLLDGTGTRRVDAGCRAGHPGAVCIMPEGHNSEWEITTPFRFVHLYVADEQLRGSYASIHDRDARRLDLPEVTFAEMPQLAPALGAMAQAAWRGDVLMADAAQAELVSQLGSRPVTLRGGLSPHLLRRMDDWIDAHLDGRIRLADLAGLTGLSSFHLHRMFRAARGLTLHDWIMRQRVARARGMLATGDPLIQIAMACGFSSQSHFTRCFKDQTALTPQAYRAALGLDRH